MTDLKELERRLWPAADALRANSRLTPAEYRGPVLGLITFGNRVGSAIGPWLGGAIFDLTGSYRVAFAASMAALGIAAAAFWGAGRRAGAP